MELTAADADAPRPDRARDAGEFVAALRQLRHWSGRSYRELAMKARQAGDELPSSTIASVLGRATLPRRPFVTGFARACGLSEPSVAAWGRARDRLAVQQDRVASSETAGTEATHGVLPRQLPVDVHTFVGREEQLRVLDEFAAGSAPMVVISGMAGAGKSSLAVHWTHRMSASFPDGQLFVNLRGHGPGQRMSAVEALSYLLQSLGVAQDLTPGDEQRAAGLFRSVTADKRLIVLLDNAMDAEQVRPLLPGGAGTRVLVTSRGRLAGLVARDGAVEIALPEMPRDDAVRLLGEVLGQEVVDREAGAAGDLADLCGGLPLALRIAAATVDRSAHDPIAAFVTRLRTGDRLGALAIRGDPQAAVGAAFDQSYQSLGTAQRVFRLLGALPVAEVTAQVAAVLTGCTRKEVQTHLDRLADAHMLTRTASGRYGMHDLLRAYARRLTAQLDPPDERTAALSRAYRWYLGQAEAAARSLYPQLARLPVTGESEASPDEPGKDDPGKDDPGKDEPGKDEPGIDEPGIGDPAVAARWLGDERHNLVAIATSAAADGVPEIAWLLSATLRGDFMACRDTAAWQAVARAALAAAEAHGDVAGQAAAHLSLGLARLSLGDYTTAIGHSEQSARLAAKAGWPHGQAAALNMLGVCCSYLGYTEQASEHLRRALAMHRTAGRRSGIAIALNNLGTISTLSGRLDLADRQLRQALALHTTSGARRGAASALLNLGVVHRNRGEATAARQRLTEAAETYRRLRDVEGEATALSNLALVELLTGDTDSALANARTALSALRRAGDLHAQALALCALAAVRREFGQTELALTHFRSALRLAEQAHSRQAAVEALIGLAELTAGHARYNQSIRYAARALDTARWCGYRPFADRALRLLAFARHGKAIGTPRPH